jgi:exopolysaccharide biosynthesis polyprenyl glycosylphosphotransferase
MSIRLDSQATFVTNVKGVFKSNARNIPISFSESPLLLGLIDALMVILAAQGGLLLLKMTTAMSLNMFDPVVNWIWFPVLVAGWWILAWINDLYDIPSSTNATLNIARVGIAAFLGLLVYGVTFFATIPMPTRYFLGYFLLLAPLFLIFWRWTYAKVLSMPLFCHRVIIVGSGERSKSIANTLKQKSLGNYEILGYVNDCQDERGPLENDLPVLGGEADLPFLVEALQVHRIVVAKQRILEYDTVRYLVESQALGARLSLMPDLYGQLYRRIPIEHIDPIWALHALQGRAGVGNFQQSITRLADIFLAVVGLVILSPVFPLLGLAIRLDSPGPILYRQIRCGKAGKPFSIIKLRTMKIDAEEDGKARWATERDPRITRVGFYLRKTRLDELPQLLNMLKGEMSFIGPRPERPEFVKELQEAIPFYRTRLMVKPGLTGWAQVHYDYGNSVEDALVKLQYDFYYMRHWSLLMDLYIIFRTIGVVLKFKGT